MTPIKPFGVLLRPRNKNTCINELNISELRKLLCSHYLVVLRGFEVPSESEQFADYCAHWGEVCEWPFGKMLELVQRADPKDHIFDHSYVPLHWDGMYRPQVPEFQIFHCVAAPLLGQGGRTIFSNTVSVLENSTSDMLQMWRSVEGVYRRKMQYYNSKTTSPIITRHPQKNYHVIRYGEMHAAHKGNLVNPPEITFVGLSEGQLKIVHDSLKKMLYKSDYCYKHQWHTNDILIADNFSLLHGREAFVPNSNRHIRRVQVLSNPPYKNPHLESY